MKCLPLIAAAMLCIAAGCAKIESTSPPETEKNEQPQQELYNATITFYQDDRINGILHAGRIRKFERQSIILLDSGIVMDFFNAKGQHTSKLWADSGRTDETRKDMVAMGNVIARSDSGETLETSELRWDNKSRQIRSDVPVKMMTRTDTTYGISFVSDENLKNFSIEQFSGLTFRAWERRTRDSLAASVDTTEANEEVDP